MTNINEIPPFPNPGVRLVKEDEHVAIWEEVFEPGKPTAPHRHTRDYIFIFPNGGDLTNTPLAGKEEESVLIAGGDTGVVHRDGRDAVGHDCGEHDVWAGTAGRG